MITTSRFLGKLYQDLNGDGTVDRIRINGPEEREDEQDIILVREIDYSAHKDEFNYADELLAKERDRTSRR